MPNKLQNVPLSIRFIIQTILTLIFLFFVFYSYPAESILQRLWNIAPSTYAWAFTLIAFNIFLSSVRFFLLLRDLGVEKSFATSFYINVWSLLGNLLPFNYFSQSLVRYSLLINVDRSPAMAFILTAFERTVAFTFLFFMALAGTFWLAGIIKLELKTGGPLLFLFFNLFMVFLAVTWFGIRRQLTLIRRVSLRPVFWCILRVSLVTIAMHISMLGTFLVLARELVQDASLSVLAAVSVIVMLAAALPISFAGWGIREMSAASLFDVVGLAPESGIILGVTVGFLSLIALSTNLIFVFLLRQDSVPLLSALSNNRTANSLFMRILSYGVPVLVAVLIGFQAKLATATGWLTLNLADPFAIVGGLVFALVTFTKKGWGDDVWRIQKVNFALVMITVAICLAFLHGWAVFGVTDWALYNRFLGWFLLLCYLLTGALITKNMCRIGLHAMARVWIVTCVTITIIEIFMKFGSQFVGLDITNFYTNKGFPRFSGMIGNPNAFGFQLLFAMSIGLAGRCFWGTWRHGRAIQVLFLGVLFAGVGLSGSRAAFLAMLVILIGSLLLRKSNVRQLVSTAGVGLVILFLMTMAGSGGTHSSVRADTFFGLDRGIQVRDDRKENTVLGWKMFVSQPVFGSGLGAYKEKYTEKDTEKGMEKPMVIDSSYLWLLAEFGIVGFLVFLIIPGNVFLWIWKNRVWVWEWDWVIVAGIGCLVIFGIMSLVHELVYQRILWFMCGALFAVPKYLKK